MDSREVGKYWNQNAPVWTELARAGYDVYRDYLNTPAFLRLLPSIEGLDGLDIGCGEGYNTRLLARLGAKMTGLDIAPSFVAAARERERKEQQGIRYLHGDAAELPFPPGGFDFATAFMSLMDMPEVDTVFQEAYRVLKPGGFFQFSITHPCFDTPHRRNLRDDEGRTYAVEVGDYFEGCNGQIAEWIFSAAPPELRGNRRKFRIPRFTRTLSDWLNAIMEAGFRLEELNEPRPDDETVKQCPSIQDAQVVAYFLHVRVRKPAEVPGPERR